MTDFSILRENDIRGVYGKNITEEVALLVGKAFGTFLKNNQLNKCIVGYDNRLSGESLTLKVVEGLNDCGINVIMLGRVTTPILNYATIKLENEAGIMVTASHNPANENGFKLFGKNYLHLDEKDLNTVYDLIKSQKFVKGKGNVHYYDIKNEYINYLKSIINLGDRKLKVGIDTGNGTTSIFIKEIMKSFNIDAYYLNSVSDGSFPKHNPDPNVKANLKELCKLVREERLDIGIAYDGDGDRVGIVDELGQIIESDKLLAIFARNILVNTDNKRLILDVKCSKALVEDLKKLNIEPIMLKNGSAYIESELFKRKVYIGGEYSGHIFFRDNHYGYDDGIYVGLRMLEILSKNKNKKLSSYLDGYNKYYNTEELRIKTTDELKWKIVEQVKEYAINKSYDFLDIDGVRVEFDDGWALVRASNTGPQLSIRFEASTEKRLADIQKEFMDLVNKLNINPN